MILSSGDDRECMSTDTKTVRTAPQMALDMVETGDGDPRHYGMDEKFSKKIPEGVSYQSKAAASDTSSVAAFLPTVFLSVR